MGSFHALYPRPASDTHTHTHTVLRTILEARKHPENCAETVCVRVCLVRGLEENSVALVETTMAKGFPPVWRRTTGGEIAKGSGGGGTVPLQGRRWKPDSWAPLSP